MIILLDNNTKKLSRHVVLFITYNMILELFNNNKNWI